MTLRNIANNIVLVNQILLHSVDFEMVGIINRLRVENGNEKITDRVTKLDITWKDVGSLDKFKNIEELTIHISNPIEPGDGLDEDFEKFKEFIGDVPVDERNLKGYFKKYKAFIKSLKVKRLTVLFGTLEKDGYERPAYIHESYYVFPNVEYININNTLIHDRKTGEASTHLYWEFMYNQSYQYKILQHFVDSRMHSNKISRYSLSVGNHLPGSKEGDMSREIDDDIHVNEGLFKAILSYPEYDIVDEDDESDFSEDDYLSEDETSDEDESFEYEEDEEMIDVYIPRVDITTWEQKLSSLITKPITLKHISRMMDVGFDFEGRCKVPHGINNVRYRMTRTVAYIASHDMVDLDETFRLFFYFPMKEVHWIHFKQMLPEDVKNRIEDEYPEI